MKNSIYSVVVFSLLLAQAAKAEVVDRIIAIVNTEIVSQSDMVAFEKKLSQNGMVDDLLLLGKTTEQLKSDKKAEVQYLIHEKILAGEIKRLNLSVTLEKVESEIRDIAKRNHMTRNELLAAVSAQGMKVSDYQDFIKNRLERQSLIEQEVTSKIRINDEDIQAEYIRQHPNLSTGIYEYTLENIFFNAKKAGPERALERANAALMRVKSGEPFETIAEQTSEDPNFTAGGLLGSFKAGEFSKEFEGAVKDLKVGEASQVVHSHGNYYILKVIGKKLIPDPVFEKDKDKIRNAMFDASFQKHFRTWMEMKQEEAFLRINIADYR